VGVAFASPDDDPALAGSLLHGSQHPALLVAAERPGSFGRELLPPNVGWAEADEAVEAVQGGQRLVDGPR
jgi:hypothetical protein